MKNFFRRFFGTNKSSVKNVQRGFNFQSAEKDGCNEEIFFNTSQNALLSDIAYALSDLRSDALRILAKMYKEEYGHLHLDEVFYRYDKITNEWYACAPLYKWCGNAEMENLFLDLCE